MYPEHRSMNQRHNKSRKSKKINSQDIILPLTRKSTSIFSLRKLRTSPVVYRQDLKSLTNIYNTSNNVSKTSNKFNPYTLAQKQCNKIKVKFNIKKMDNKLHNKVHTTSAHCLLSNKMSKQEKRNKSNIQKSPKYQIQNKINSNKRSTCDDIKSMQSNVNIKNNTKSFRKKIKNIFEKQMSDTTLGHKSLKSKHSTSYPSVMKHNTLKRKLHKNDRRNKVLSHNILQSTINKSDTNLEKKNLQLKKISNKTSKQSSRDDAKKCFMNHSIPIDPKSNTVTTTDANKTKKKLTALFYQDICVTGKKLTLWAKQRKSNKGITSDESCTNSCIEVSNQKLQNNNTTHNYQLTSHLRLNKLKLWERKHRNAIADLTESRDDIKHNAIDYLPNKSILEENVNTIINCKNIQPKQHEFISSKRVKLEKKDPSKNITLKNAKNEIIGNKSQVIDLYNIHTLPNITFPTENQYVPQKKVHKAISNSCTISRNNNNDETNAVIKHTKQPSMPMEHTVYSTNQKAYKGHKESSFKSIPKYTIASMQKCNEPSIYKCTVPPVKSCLPYNSTIYCFAQKQNLNLSEINHLSLPVLDTEEYIHKKSSGNMCNKMIRFVSGNGSKEKSAETIQNIHQVNTLVCPEHPDLGAIRYHIRCEKLRPVDCHCPKDLKQCTKCKKNISSTDTCECITYDTIRNKVKWYKQLKKDLRMECIRRQKILNDNRYNDAGLKLESMGKAKCCCHCTGLRLKKQNKKLKENTLKRMKIDDLDSGRPKKTSVRKTRNIYTETGKCGDRLQNAKVNSRCVQATQQQEKRKWFGRSEEQTIYKTTTKTKPDLGRRNIPKRGPSKGTVKTQVITKQVITKQTTPKKESKKKVPKKKDSKKKDSKKKDSKKKESKKKDIKKKEKQKPKPKPKGAKKSKLCECRRKGIFRLKCKCLRYLKKCDCRNVRLTNQKYDCPSRCDDEKKKKMTHPHVLTEIMSTLFDCKGTSTEQFRDGDIFIRTLGKRPWFFIYRLCPRLYPSFISCLQRTKAIFRMSMSGLAILFWIPCLMLTALAVTCYCRK